MAMPEERPQPGLGASLTTERESCRRLMAQGLTHQCACVQSGVHVSSGMRWRKSRNMVNRTGKARCYAHRLQARRAFPAVSPPRRNGSRSLTSGAPPSSLKAHPTGNGPSPLTRPPDDRHARPSPKWSRARATQWSHHDGKRRRSPFRPEISPASARCVMLMSCSGTTPLTIRMDVVP